MKKLALIKSILLAISLISSTVNAQDFEWARSIGGPNNDFGGYVTLDDSGNVYTTGYFAGTGDFDPGLGTFNLTSVGNFDVFVQKMDPAGNLLWAKSFGGSAGDHSYAIAIDNSGNIYTTGYFEGTVDFDPGVGTFNLTSNGIYDVFVQKMDASGNFLWARSFGGNDVDIAYSITTDNSGNVYTTGPFRSTADFDPGAATANLTSMGSDDIFIQKMDASGNFLWARSFGGTVQDGCRSVSVDAAGNVYTSGYFVGTVDFDPGAGTFNVTANGDYDAFVHKLDAAGNLLWVRNFGGASGTNANAVQVSVDTSGNVITNGNFFGTSDFDPGVGTTNLTSAGGSDVFVHKMDSFGNFLWAKSFGGNDDDQVIAITTDMSQNIYNVGRFEGTSDFDPGTNTTNLTSVASRDIFIQKLDSSGNFFWAVSFGGTGSDSGNSIDIDTSGNVYTSGNFANIVDFDPGVGIVNLDAGGPTFSSGIFVHKMSQCLPNNATDTQTACGSYTWIDGNTYTSSNTTAMFTLTNAAGCDSVVTLNLTINNPNTGVDVESACDSYTWIDGNTYTSNNSTATQTLTNAAGCDSVVTLNLTINSNTGTDVQTTCDSFTWIDGITYTSNNNTATQTLTNAAGCDSVVTLNLTINTVSDITTSTSGASISANNASATYQWIDCDNGNASITAETGQTFTATANGNYAVELTENGCVDTSACTEITSVGIIENDFGHNFILYPNPTDGNFSIDLGAVYESVQILITDISGKLIDSKAIAQSQYLSISMDEPAGIYIISVEAGTKNALIRLVKE